MNVLALALDPSSPATLYAGTAAGIYKSTDAGASWTALREDLYVSALTLSPRDPRVLFAGTQEGVLRSDDSGAMWTRVPLVP